MKTRTWRIMAALLALAIVLGSATAVIAGGIGHPWLQSAGNAVPEGAIEAADTYQCGVHGWHHYSQSSRTAQITSPGGSAWFKMSINATDGGKIMILSTGPTQGGPANVDTEITVFKSDGTYLGYDDQSGPGDFSMLAINIPANITTTLWVRVSHWIMDEPSAPFALNTTFLRSLMPMAAKLSKGDSQSASAPQPQLAEKEPARSGVNLMALPQIQILGARTNDLATVEIQPIGGDTSNRVRK